MGAEIHFNLTDPFEGLIRVRKEQKDGQYYINIKTKGCQLMLTLQENHYKALVDGFENYEVVDNTRELMVIEGEELEIYKKCLAKRKGGASE